MFPNLWKSLHQRQTRCAHSVGSIEFLVDQSVFAFDAPLGHWDGRKAGCQSMELWAFCKRMSGKKVTAILAASATLFTSEPTETMRSATSSTAAQCPGCGGSGRAARAAGNGRTVLHTLLAEA
eukprot:10520431-Lingulodinium_polyedra.AAC.1